MSIDKPTDIDGDGLQADHSALWLMVVLAVGAGIRYVAEVMFARWSDPSAFGTYAYFLAAAYIASAVGSLGLPSAALRFVPRLISEKNLATLRQFLVAGRRIVAAGGVAGAIVIAIGQSFVGPGWPGLAVVLGLFVLVPGLALAQFGVSVGRAGHSLLAGDTTHSLLLPALALAAGAALSYLTGERALSAAHLIACMSVAAAAAYVTHAWVFRRTFYPTLSRTSVGLRSASRFARLAAPVAIASTLHLVLGRFDILIVGATQPAATTATYAAAARIAAVLGLILVAINGAHTYRLSTLAQQRDQSSLMKVATHVSRLTVALTVLVAAVLWVGDEIVLGLFGPAYLQGITTLRILIFNQVVNALAGPTLLLAFVSSNYKDATISLLLGLAGTAITAVALLEPMSSEGVAIAVVVGTATWNAILAFRLKRSLGVGGTAFGF